MVNDGNFAAFVSAVGKPFHGGDIAANGELGNAGDFLIKSLGEYLWKK